MISIDDLKTRAGLLLTRQLPEEYRYQDPAAEGEFGDLEAYLHGFGHLLDLIRGTTEQAYADAFAEAPDIPGDGFGNSRDIQTWLLPYLAELVGAVLLAPDPEKRTEELNNAVGWFKTKGTLQNIDSVADVVSGAETVLVEGWRRVLLTPRLDLPPFTGPAGAMGDGDPLGPPALPLGTPDIRVTNRAVIDPDGANPLYRLVMPDRNADGTRAEPVITYWRPRARHGVPCFAGAFDDTAVRTPDLRNPDYPDVGPHPRRSLIHIRPPNGLFEPKLREVGFGEITYHNAMMICAWRPNSQFAEQRPIKVRQLKQSRVGSHFKNILKYDHKPISHDGRKDTVSKPKSKMGLTNCVWASEEFQRCY